MQSQNARAAAWRRDPSADARRSGAIAARTAHRRARREADPAPRRTAVPTPGSTRPPPSVCVIMACLLDCMRQPPREIGNRFPINCQAGFVLRGMRNAPRDPAALRAYRNSKLYRSLTRICASTTGGWSPASRRAASRISRRHFRRCCPISTPAARGSGSWPGGPRVTRQAAGQLLREIERCGYVERGSLLTMHGRRQSVSRRGESIFWPRCSSSSRQSKMNSRPR